MVQGRQNLLWARDVGTRYCLWMGAWASMGVPHIRNRQYKMCPLLTPPLTSSLLPQEGTAQAELQALRQSVALERRGQAIMGEAAQQGTAAGAAGTAGTAGTAGATQGGPDWAVTPSGGVTRAEPSAPTKAPLYGPMQPHARFGAEETPTVHHPAYTPMDYSPTERVGAVQFCKGMFRWQGGLSM